MSTAAPKLSVRQLAWLGDMANVPFAEEDEGRVSGEEDGGRVFEVDLGEIQDDAPIHNTPPVQDHYFSDLNKYSTKYLKFQQRKSMAAIPDSTGVCLAVALMWLREKIKTTSSRYGKGRPVDKVFAVPASETDIHAHNANIMMKADGYQGLLDNGADISPISNALNLVSDPHLVSTSWRRNDANVRVVDFAKTLEIAAASLTKGKAICVEVLVRRPDQETAGHAVSMYRSRGGTLHFFDSNAGAYEVRDIQQFMEAWVAGCGKRGWTVSPYFRKSESDEDHSWYHVYIRD